MINSGKTVRRLMVTGVALGALAACDQPLDWDLRDLGGMTLDTSASVRNLAARPQPDNRGVISYPNYQVVVARQDDTVRTVAGRLGINADALARYNGITSPDVALRDGEIVALPARVSEPSAATGALTSGPIMPPSVDVTTLASDALNRAGPQAQTELTAETPVAATPAQTGFEPIRHQVQRGETAYSISRLYGVPVRSVADWNALDADLSIREGQFLLIPQAGASAPNNTGVSRPGAGSITPTPPSASAPLPSEVAGVITDTPTTPNLATATTSDALLIMPVDGSIIRAYARGRNEGIDIGAAAGANVKAAADGVVAAVTRDTNGVAIVVIRHANNLLTVYTNLDELTVEKDSRVSQGDIIGKIKAGSPSFLHFEVREGLESTDPASYLP